MYTYTLKIGTRHIFNLPFKPEKCTSIFSIDDLTKFKINMTEVYNSIIYLVLFSAYIWKTDFGMSTDRIYGLVTQSGIPGNSFFVFYMYVCACVWRIQHSVIRQSICGLWCMFDYTYFDQPNQVKTLFEPSHEKQGPFGFPGCYLNAHAQSPTWATDMIFCLKRPQSFYYMSANSKGSGETALMRSLFWVFAGRLCEKFPFLMRWLIYLWYTKRSHMKIQNLTKQLLNKTTSWENQCKFKTVSPISDYWP